MSVHCFDVLDTVHVSLSVRDYGEYELGTGETILIREGFAPGVGESDAREWASDVLVWLLEGL